MTHEITTNQTTLSIAGKAVPLPSLIEGAGERARYKFVEFFAATIRNNNTRDAYARAVYRFLARCDLYKRETVDPLAVAAHVEEHTHERAAPTVKQHLAAIKGLLDWFVVNGGDALQPGQLDKGAELPRQEGEDAGAYGRGQPQALRRHRPRNDHRPA